MGHLVMTEAMVGKSLVESLTCKSCHKQDEESIGPAYTAVASKYEKDPQAESHLINKIIKGGTGVWGETMMPANPEMKRNDARKIVSWILSLSGNGEGSNSLPATGSIDPTIGKPISANGVFILSASFMDSGGENIKPLAGSNSLTLQNSLLDFERAANVEGFNPYNMDGRNIMIAPKRPGHFSFNQIDLTDVTAVEIKAGSRETLEQGYKLVVKLDSPEGKSIGETVIQAPDKNKIDPNVVTSIPTTVQIDPVEDGKLHDLYIVSEPIGKEEVTMTLVSMELKSE
jgi:cytochrome c551/c552